MPESNARERFRCKLCGGDNGGGNVRKGDKGGGNVIKGDKGGGGAIQGDKGAETFPSLRNQTPETAGDKGGEPCGPPALLPA
eukprot:2237223-Rhodomonas_salina.1